MPYSNPGFSTERHAAPTPHIPGGVRPPPVGGAGRLFLRCAIIFGISTSNAHAGTTHMQTPSRAFIRHAIQVYYRDLAQVGSRGTTLVWQKTFNVALRYKEFGGFGG